MLKHPRKGVGQIKEELAARPELEDCGHGMQVADGIPGSSGGFSVDQHSGISPTAAKKATWLEVARVLGSLGIGRDDARGRKR